MTRKKESKKTRIYWIAMAIFTLFLMMSCGKKTVLSEDLIGTWKTSDLKYGDAYFELEREAVVFGTKDGDIHSFPILKVKKRKMQDEDWTLYTIFYKTIDFQKVEFPFYFRAGSTGLIRFKNQPSLVWQKTTIGP
jgi:hypothetical protein